MLRPCYPAAAAGHTGACWPLCGVLLPIYTKTTHTTHRRTTKQQKNKPHAGRAKQGIPNGGELGQYRRTLTQAQARVKGRDPQRGRAQAVPTNPPGMLTEGLQGLTLRLPDMPTNPALSEVQTMHGMRRMSSAHTRYDKRHAVSSAHPIACSTEAVLTLGTTEALMGLSATTETT